MGGVFSYGVATPVKRTKDQRVPPEAMKPCLLFLLALARISFRRPAGLW